ncbi:MAG: hypothetical protein AAFR05_20535 [Bacteroidota bacterium]
MKIILRNTKTSENVEATISRVSKGEIPLKKDGWQFNWRQLYKIEGAEIYKLSTNENPKIIEGVLMITIFNGEMVFMNNVEIAPHNYGSKGIYKEVAGCLIAYACLESFERGKKGYTGFLSFDSKTQLIKLYQDKYGAKIAMGNKMYFDPLAGKALLKKYLNIDSKY